jgi:uncharacterized zinc-type alcohol dehydrogenase-like protein
MGAKLAKAMGAEVVIFTTTKEKVAEAEKLGAVGVYSKDKEALHKYKQKFDFILSTVPEKSELNPFIQLLKLNATLAIVGDLAMLGSINNMFMAAHRNAVAGSLIGGIRQTQEVLNFCAEHNVTPDVQLISIEEVNDAYKKVEASEVRFRYVIDMASLKKSN